MRVFLVLTILSTLLFNCAPSYEEPRIPVDKYIIADGFELEVIASEPLLKAPVAIDFDLKGRLWAVEMNGYMLDTEGRGEDEPTGTIKILEDLDADGIMDHAKIVLDSLVMPRAMALVYGGLLYAEPPNLWFAELENDRINNKVLVDSLYAVDGNPEHQPNGLLLHLDNWIYNAASSSRYKRQNGQWIKEPTSYRGQWGISKDNFGRLYYNNNATQLMGDFMLPNRMIRDSFFVSEHNINQVLTIDQKVYPIHDTPVNRGYQDGVLDGDSILVNVTSACSPFVYRGGSFGTPYGNNAFVCIPEANLIKRNVLNFSGDTVSAAQAQIGKEFLASTDEGFRPVSLSDGPNGNLYVVDMHRGLLQHYAFLTPYLKAKSLERQLDTLINSGRILKITKTDREEKEKIAWDALSDLELVALLKHENGWVRDRAQHLLVYQKKTEIILDLEKLAKDTVSPITQIHALHSLKGLDGLKIDLLTEVALSGATEVSAHAIVLFEDYVDSQYVDLVKGVFQKLMGRNDKMIDLYLLSTLGKWAAMESDMFSTMTYALTEKYLDNPVYEEALLSGAGEIRDDLVSGISKMDSSKSANLLGMLQRTIDRKNKHEPNSIFVTNTMPMDGRTSGSKLFSKICASCHSLGGEGITGLAPPLLNSEYVRDSKQLALIILHGMKGPVIVDEKRYEFNGTMTGLKDNSTLTDKDISDLISYVTNAFTADSRYYPVEKIAEFRKIEPKDGAFTAEELIEIDASQGN